MSFPYFPPQLHERVVCSIAASVDYQVPANIMLAIAEIENGKPHQWVENTNGTADIGVMQFNTAYLADLGKYGITPQDVSQNGCYPYQLAAWRIHGHLLKDKGDIWTRAADYHSYKPYSNAAYRAKLVQHAAKWQDWLENHVDTYAITSKHIDQPVKTESFSYRYSHVHYNLAAQQALSDFYTPPTGELSHE